MSSLPSNTVFKISIIAFLLFSTSLLIHSLHTRGVFLIAKLFSSTFFSFSIDLVIMLPYYLILIHVHFIHDFYLVRSLLMNKKLRRSTSPCLPDLPLSCSSTLLDSCLSVPIIANHHYLLSFRELMSVPLPAIFSIVVPGFPSAISASLLACVGLVINFSYLTSYLKVQNFNSCSQIGLSIIFSSIQLRGILLLVSYILYLPCQT